MRMLKSDVACTSRKHALGEGLERTWLNGESTFGKSFDESFLKSVFSFQPTRRRKLKQSTKRGKLVFGHDRQITFSRGSIFPLIAK